MSTSQVAFYKNRVGKFEKMALDKHKQTDKRNPEVTNLWHIYSHTLTAHKLRRTVTRVHYEDIKFRYYTT